MKGEWRNAPCVVKMLLDTNPQSTLRFMEEVARMRLTTNKNFIDRKRSIRPHPNICKFFGACTQPGAPLCLVLEWLPGDGCQGIFDT